MTGSSSSAGAQEASPNSAPPTKSNEQEEQPTQQVVHDRNQVTSEAAAAAVADNTNNANNSSKIKRNPFCSRCRNHGKSALVKGHKRHCEYRNCQCEGCLLVEQRQKISAAQIKLRREQKQDEESFRQLKILPPVLVSSIARATQDQHQHHLNQLQQQQQQHQHHLPATTLMPMYASMGAAAAAGIAHHAPPPLLPVSAQEAHQAVAGSVALKSFAKLQNCTPQSSSSDIPTSRPTSSLDGSTDANNKICQTLNNGNQNSQTTSDAANHTSNNKSKRNPFCSRCRNHGKSALVKGHKRHCEYRNCQCEGCVLVEQRQKISAAQIKLRREQKQDEESGRQLKISPPVLVSCSVTTQDRLTQHQHQHQHHHHHLHHLQQLQQQHQQHHLHHLQQLQQQQQHHQHQYNQYHQHHQHLPTAPTVPMYPPVGPGGITNWADHHQLFLLLNYRKKP